MAPDAPLPLDRCQALFPLERPPPPPQTFELGLVLGGTVAAAAYTAGALDFLVQALDAWHASNPPHQVRIPFTAGASGGGVCATLLGLLSARRFPPITQDQHTLLTQASDRGNLLFDIWVNRFHIDRLLDDEDLRDGGALMSGLNGRFLDRVAEELVRFARSATGQPHERVCFPKPYRWAVTLSNTRGVPYQLKVAAFDGFEGAMFVQHDDFARFAIPNGITPAAAPLGQREDEFWVDPERDDPAAGVISYARMAQFALGTAAFPGGFPARVLERPEVHYALRPMLHPRQGFTTYADVKWPRPLTSAMKEPGQRLYRFVTVDGGVFNNDPVSLAHRELAGLLGRNPRQPQEATRALFMIDPLASLPAVRRESGSDLASVLTAVIGAAIGGARYLTADMQLLGDPECFSRFQLVPSRMRGTERLLGEDALTGSCLAAFGGFLSRPFRVHDFLLGRHNMERYLRRTLTLRGDNPLFDRWDAGLRADHACDAEGGRVSVSALSDPAGYYLPVIPLRPEVAGAPLPDWPVGALRPETLRKPFDTRIEKVLHVLQGLIPAGPLLQPLIGLVIDAIASDKVADALIAGLTDDLRTKRLI